MQDRYVGDIGDFVKLGILRALGSCSAPGVIWWKFPDEAHNRDGRHVGYLERPELWRHFDDHLFDQLSAIVRVDDRNLAALEGSGVLPDAVFVSAEVPTNGTPAERRLARANWFKAAKEAVDACDLVFVDPDNGLETAGFSPGAKAAGKSVSLQELRALARPGRTLIVYHHQTRRRGGHEAELRYWGQRLRDAGFTSVDALRAPRYSVWAFFILDAPPELRELASQLADRWGKNLEWFPELREG